MSALYDWGAKQIPPVKIPGKVAVAYAVIESDEIPLRPEAEAALVQLHRLLTQGFERNGRMG